MLNTYNGSHGFGKIGSFDITIESNPNEIVKHISNVFKIHMKKRKDSHNTMFNPYTYSTTDHGQLETIKDIDGNVYGYDHGSCCTFGFNN